MAALRVALVAVLVTILLPAEALGHAKLLRSAPSDGDVLERVPRAVVLTFDAPMAPPADGHAQSATGEVTEVAFAAARGTGYLAIALAIGGVVFLLVVWLPAVAR